MGVHGLWSLLEPAGKPIALETLENKVLSVDISIWLNQAVKGFRDRAGNAVPNAHLLGLFHRICKLLFYRIKPVFVFDGQAPLLKKETLRRRRMKLKAASKSSQAKSAQILENFVRSQMVSAQLGKKKRLQTADVAEILRQRHAQLDTDIFELPPLPSGQDEDGSSSSSSSDGQTEMLRSKFSPADIHQMDVKHPDFASLSKDLQYEILSELKERRKHNSWRKMSEMPKKADSFSSFQLQRLMKRNEIQKTLENVGKQLGEEAASVLHSQLFVGDREGLRKAKAEAKRIASCTSGNHCILISGLKQAVDELLQPTALTQISSRSGGTAAPGALPCMIAESTEPQTEASTADTSDISHADVDQSKLGDSDLPEPARAEAEGDEENTIAPAAGMVTFTQQDLQSKHFSTDEANLFSEVFVAPSASPLSFMSTSSSSSPSPSPSPQPTQAQRDEGPEESSSEQCSNIAQTMKNSEHLWLKIASKWAEEVKESDSEQEEDIKEQETDDAALEAERVTLLQEMISHQNDERLLKFKDPDHGVSTEPGSSTAAASSSGLRAASHEKATLKRLGVNVLSQEQIEQAVLDDADHNSYGSSAEGFVRVQRGVIELSDQDQLPSSTSNQDFLSSQITLDHSEIHEEELKALQERLATEQKALIAQRSHQDRLAATISDQMYADCQELLQLFGLPWIVSPSEAEAQCAFLDQINLCHGTITDDSDVWVFGGRRVYKNFFSQTKYCEQFSVADLTSHFGLDREKMILLAELTGSDYTDGVRGVGPVTALEILSEFSGRGLHPLLSFKDWWQQLQSQTRRPGSKLQAKLARLRLPEGFPSQAVFDAYMNPVVDASTEAFSWAVPNFVAVREFATERFGWPTQKIDEMLKPVLKRLNMKSTQQRIDNYFLSQRSLSPDKGHYHSSKRVQQAIEKVVHQAKVQHPQEAKEKPKQRLAKTTDESVKRPPPKTIDDRVEVQPAKVQPAKDWRREEELLKHERKRKAIELFKQHKSSSKAGAASISKSRKPKRSKRQVVLPGHQLSEESDDGC